MDKLKELLRGIMEDIQNDTESEGGMVINDIAYTLSELEDMLNEIEHLDGDEEEYEG